jgi:Zn ribbon nucleic-acid-binding protein
MAAATRNKTTFGVTCPFCFDADAVISLDLNCVGTIRCSSCDEEFTAQQARNKAAETLAAWEKVVRFVELARDLT